jgi:hypothetical protein
VSDFQSFTQLIFLHRADNVGVGLVVTKNAWESIFLHNFITKRLVCWHSHFFFFIFVYTNIFQHESSDENYYQLQIQTNRKDMTHMFIVCEPSGVQKAGTAGTAETASLGKPICGWTK